MGVILALLAWERVRLSRLRKKVPLRICVTGSRGKSTVTRLIAGAMRESGRRVLAKTTGSKPVVILPSGEERDIKRRGIPSILEQKKILRDTVESGADVLVSEMMSIRPDSLAAESRGILKPTHLVITNARLDHLDDMGPSREDVAASLAAGVNPGCVVFVPEEEMCEAFRRAAEKRGACLVEVSPLNMDSVRPGPARIDDFEENVRLALAAAESAGVDADTAVRGMAKARPDYGSLKIWTAEWGEPRRIWNLVSAFAANEPASTRKVLDALRRRMPLEGKKVIGLLNFRPDRGERTIQWLDAVESGFFEGFSRIVFTGAHIRSLRVRKTCGISPLPAAVVPGKDPERIMKTIAEMEPGDAVLVGMGNIVGLGQEILEYWERIGTPRHA